MDMRNQKCIRIFAVCVILILAGCNGIVTQDSDKNQTKTDDNSRHGDENMTRTDTPETGDENMTRTDTPETFQILSETPLPMSNTVACSEGISVTLWGIRDGFWSKDEIAVALYLPPNVTVHFVALVDGSSSGVAKVSNENEDGINIDGKQIPLKQELEGYHTVRVVAFKDTNQNGEFDMDTDHACEAEDRIIQSGPYRVNFSRV